MSRYRFTYSFIFAVVNFAEAFVQLVCIGLWSPNWVMSYAAGYAQRNSSVLAHNDESNRTTTTMTPEQRIDAAIDSVLKAAGSALKHYTSAKTLADMRDAMRNVMSDSYLKGSNDNFEAMKKSGHKPQAERRRKASASSDRLGHGAKH